MAGCQQVWHAKDVGVWKVVARERGSDVRTLLMQAARAYDAAVMQFGGDDSQLNFPLSPLQQAASGVADAAHAASKRAFQEYAAHLKSQTAQVQLAIPLHRHLRKGCHVASFALRPVGGFLR